MQVCMDWSTTKKCHALASKNNASHYGASKFSNLTLVHSSLKVPIPNVMHGRKTQFVAIMYLCLNNNPLLSKTNKNSFDFLICNYFETHHIILLFICFTQNHLGFSTSHKSKTFINKNNQAHIMNRSC